MAKPIAYEYKIVHMEPNEDRLNELGAEGWQLVDAEHSITSAEMIFIREKRG